MNDGGARPPLDDHRQTANLLQIRHLSLDTPGGVYATPWLHHGRIAPIAVGGGTGLLQLVSDLSQLTYTLNVSTTLYRRVPI